MAPTSPIDWECSSGAYLPHQYACRRDGRCPSLTEGKPPASASTTQVAQPRRPHGRGPSSCGPALSWVIWWSAGPSGVPSIACDGKVNVLSTLSAFQGTHSRGTTQRHSTRADQFFADSLCKASDTHTALILPPRNNSRIPHTLCAVLGAAAPAASSKHAADRGDYSNISIQISFTC